MAGHGMGIGNARVCCSPWARSHRCGSRSCTRRKASGRRCVGVEEKKEEQLPCGSTSTTRRSTGTICVGSSTTKQRTAQRQPEETVLRYEIYTPVLTRHAPSHLRNPERPHLLPRRPPVVVQPTLKRRRRVLQLLPDPTSSVRQWHRVLPQVRHPTWVLASIRRRVDGVPFEKEDQRPSLRLFPLVHVDYVLHELPHRPNRQRRLALPRSRLRTSALTRFSEQRIALGRRARSIPDRRRPFPLVRGGVGVRAPAGEGAVVVRF